MYSRAIFVLFVTSNFFLLCVSDNLKIIPKCCPKNEVVLNNMNFPESCIRYQKNPLNYFSNLTIYDKDVHDKALNMSFSDVFQVSPENRPDNDSFTQYYSMIPAKFILMVMSPFLNSEGILYVQYSNNYDRWKQIKGTEFCVDYAIESHRNIISDHLEIFCILPGKPPEEISYVYTAAQLTSSVFLVVVLVVYMLLPNLRNLKGKILMAFVLSLLVAFIFLSVLQLKNYSPTVCIILTTIVYFAVLASFFWMNVMSIDIWWTFRGRAKARQINRRGETFKFFTYCCYGWGLPLAMTIFFFVMNSIPLSHKPWIIQPLIPDAGCFLEGGQKFIYLYVPMLILILSNWLFYLMTAFNIWRLHRGTEILESSSTGTPAAHLNQRERFFVYMKLSVLMGVNWLLEVINSFSPHLKFWIIADLYNLLVGVVIFLIFVFKKNIYIQLKARYYQWRNPEQNQGRSHTRSTLSTDVSAENIPLQVNVKPNGTNIERDVEQRTARLSNTR